MKLRNVVLLTSIVLIAACASSAAAPSKVKVLIVNGQNNHDWEALSKAMKETLDAVGRFDVDVSTSPPPNSPREAWDKWQPQFSKYKALVIDYNGDMWPEKVKADFVRYVRNGGGVVMLHAAQNSFTGWKEWEEMCGLCWRDKDYGDGITIDDATGKQIRTPKGQGNGAGHGQQHDFVVKVRQPKHPIMAGLPEEWLHARDELYHNQRGPAKNMTVLSSAYDDPKVKGTGKHEAVTWVIPFGKGKVVTTVPGHTWKGQPMAPGVRCVGWQLVVARSAEWVATGKVTIEVPPNFPTKTKAVTVHPDEIPWSFPGRKGPSKN